MTYKKFISIKIIIITIISLSACEPEVKPELPNIVFIMADDMGYGDVSSYNPKSLINTPAIDQLAKEGMKFTDAHSPSAVCTPTRYALLTGRYAWRGLLKRGVIEGPHTPVIEDGRKTIGTFLQDKGYNTACIGKWHLGMTFQRSGVGPAPIESGNEDGYQYDIDFTKSVLDGPTQRGFNYSFVTPGCPTDDLFNFWVENGEIRGTIIQEDQWYISEGWQHEKVDTTILSKGIQFIESHLSEQPQKPFFIYLPLSVPHIPWDPPEFVKGKSKAGNRGDQCVLADWIVQKMNSYLDGKDLIDNTIFIFTSDNGPNPNDPTSTKGHPPVGNFRGSKGMIWEGGHRIPFIVRWPGKITPGSENHDPIGLVDMFSTFAAITGSGLPSDIAEDSFNILPYWFGEQLDEPIRKDIIHHSGAGVFAIREGKWKLIVGTEEGGYLSGGPKEGAPGQLYDMETDPFEKNNLFAINPEIVDRLTQLLINYKNQGYSRPR
jgi:arylsulfatase A-like enzyme